MDYFGILKRAAQITWKYKFLWVLGFLVALASGGNSYNSWTNYSTGSGDLSGASNAGHWLSAYLVIIFLIVMVLLLIGIVFWILSRIAIGGLVGAVDGIEKNEEMSLGKAFSIGARYFFRVVGVSILIGLIMFALVMVFVIPLVGAIIVMAVQGGAVSEVIVLALFCIVPAIIIVIFLLAIVGIFMGVLTVYAIRYQVIYDAKVIESIRLGWRLIKGNKAQTLVMFLLLLLTSTVATIVVIIPGMLIGLPSALMLIAGIATNSITLIVLSVFGLVVLVVVAAVIRGIYEVFHSAAWTLAFLKQQPEAPETTPAIEPSS